MDLEPSLFGGQSLEPLLMPLDSAATKQTTAKEEHGSGQEWLKVEVLAVPGSSGSDDASSRQLRSTA